MSLVDFFAYSDGQQWMAEGACGQPEIPNDWFFPSEEAGETSVKAINVCNGCIVKDECLAYALLHGEEGVWGGKSERQRRREKRHAKEQAIEIAHAEERTAEEAGS
jgi:WhiB family redox-sensing transcriptional regulator